MGGIIIISNMSVDESMGGIMIISNMSVDESMEPPLIKTILSEI